MSKTKRIVIIAFIIIAIIAVISAVFIMQKSNEEITQYTPQEEISEEQMRQTIVSLYFKNDEELVPEARLVDVKRLLDNPYQEILTMLLEGPKNVTLKTTIPQGTKINKIKKEGENLIIDFSKEFIENHEGGEKAEKLTIKSIVNTLTELTEINGIKITIDGEENKEFKDGVVNFREVFEREDN